MKNELDITKKEKTPILNIDEIKEEKNILSEKIYDLIFEYQQKTQTKIESIQIIENIDFGFSTSGFSINIKTTY